MIERQLEPEVMDDVAESVAYDAMDHRQANTAFVERLASLGLSQRIAEAGGYTALDLGTGPGHIPIEICQRFEGVHVTAVDLAQSMLDLAQTKVDAACLGDRITLQQMDVKSLDVEDGAFDLVYSNTILHHIPEPLAMLREAGRVLRPNGLILIRDLYRPQSQAELDALVALHASDEDDEQRRLFAESLHAALTPEELRAIAQEAGLTDTEVVIDTDRHMSLQSVVP